MGLTEITTSAKSKAQRLHSIQSSNSTNEILSCVLSVINFLHKLSLGLTEDSMTIDFELGLMALILMRSPNLIRQLHVQTNLV